MKKGAVVVLIAEAPTPGLRERKKEHTRALLVDAALMLFTKKGYDSTSIDDIVNVVNVSRRTFFRYFPSKDDVLVAWIEKFGELLRDSLASRPAVEEPTRALENALICSIEIFEAQHTLTAPLERAIDGSAALRAQRLVKLKLCAELISPTLASRMSPSSRQKLAPGILAHCTIAVLLAAIDSWDARRNKGKLSEEVVKCFRQVRMEIV